LLETTAVGKKLQKQARETEAAVKALQDASKSGLTREKLLDLFINAKSEVALATLVSLARKGIDYTFFEQLTQRIDKANGEKQQKLIELREKLLTLTREIDEELKKRHEVAQQQLQTLLKAKNIKEATDKFLPQINDYFGDVLTAEIEDARKKGDLERSAKLQEIMQIIQEASAPPPEIELIQEMIDAPDDKALNEIISRHQNDITSEFLQVFSSLVNQSEESKQDPKMIEKLQNAYRMTLRHSMQANLNK
jgi:hypothetical protein